MIQKEHHVYIKTCPICGKKFGALHYSTKYCSDECHKVKIAQYNHKYYMKNREKCLKKHREWKENNREK